MCFQDKIKPREHRGVANVKGGRIHANKHKPEDLMMKGHSTCWRPAGGCKDESERFRKSNYFQVILMVRLHLWFVSLISFK